MKCVRECLRHRPGKLAAVEPGHLPDRMLYKPFRRSQCAAACSAPPSRAAQPIVTKCVSQARASLCKDAVLEPVLHFAREESDIA